MLSIYAVSTVYLSTNVSNNESINPTSDVVKFAFLGPYSNSSQANEAVPTNSTTYYAGSWPSTQPVANTVNSYRATILVGPGGTVALSTGTYLMVAKVTDSPEIPVIPCGPVSVS